MAKIYLILVLSLSLVACNQAPSFPSNVHKYAMDLNNSKCHEYVLIDAENQKYKFTQSYPITKCDGYFAASPEDTVIVSNWVRDVIAWAKTKQNGN